MTDDQVKKLFKDNKIFNATDDELDEALVILGNKTSVDNDQIVRALVINAIKDQRHIDKLDKKNQIYTFIIIVLTTVSILLQLKSLFLNNQNYRNHTYNSSINKWH